MKNLKANEMNGYSPIKAIIDIPDKEYTGYYWMSNSDAPVPVDGKFLPPLIGQNPFIIEANLIAKDEPCSYSIENIDGKYYIGKVDWSEVEKSDLELEVKTYLTHRIAVYKKVNFIQAWIPVTDHECEDMEVLKPAWRIFAGFDTLTQHLNEIIKLKIKKYDQSAL